MGTLGLTYYGQSCFLVEADEGSVVIDPFFTGNPSAGIKAEDVCCDAVLVTWGLRDLLRDTGRIAKRNNAIIVSSRFACGRLKGVRTHTLDAGGSHRFDFGTVKLFKALPDWMVIEDGGKCCGPFCGVILKTGGASILHAGYTSRLIGNFKPPRELGHADVALLPLALGELASYYVRKMEARTLIPMHHAGQNLEDFKRHVEEQTDAICVILAPGQTHTID